MRISARNKFETVIKTIKKGSVNSELELSVGHSDKIVTIITNESLEELNLKEGDKVIALIKASWVIIAKNAENLKISTRNKFSGKLVTLLKGQVNSEVVLEMSSGNKISSIITNESVKELDLKEGDLIWALFKASSVIIGIDN